MPDNLMIEHKSIDPLNNKCWCRTFINKFYDEIRHGGTSETIAVHDTVQLISSGARYRIVNE